MVAFTRSGTTANRPSRNEDPPGGPPRPQRPFPRRTRLQMKKDKYAKQVSDGWPSGVVKRTNKNSRGMHRVGNGCYRISALQALLHLPKFMNWINDHNVTQRGKIHNPCTTATTMSHNGNNFKVHTVCRQCMACAMKDLIAYYWGEDNLDASGAPNPIPQHDPILYPFERFATQLFGADQSDPGEFQLQILRACRRSTRRNGAANEKWYQQYLALFFWMFETRKDNIETDCTAVRPRGFSATNNLATINIHNNRPDDILSSIGRSVFAEERTAPIDCQDEPLAKINMTDQNGNTITDENGNPVEKQLYAQHRCRKSDWIVAAPEIIRVAVNLTTQDEKATAAYATKVEKWMANKKAGPRPVPPGFVRNTNPIQIPDVLDLTRFQTEPTTDLIYHLSSVIPHSGGVDESGSVGHYIVSVKGPQRVFTINDNQVNERVPPQLLSDNPVEKVFLAVLVIYVRYRPSIPRMKDDLEIPEYMQMADPVEGMKSETFGDPEPSDGEDEASEGEDS